MKKQQQKTLQNTKKPVKVLSQQVTTRQQWTNAKAWQKQDIHKRSTALERSVKYLLEGLNRFHGANLTLSLDVDQDTYMFGLHEKPLFYPCIIS